jgi:hypothetical protein
MTPHGQSPLRPAACTDNNHNGEFVQYGHVKSQEMDRLRTRLLAAPAIVHALPMPDRVSCARSSSKPGAVSFFNEHGAPQCDIVVEAESDGAQESPPTVPSGSAGCGSRLGLKQHRPSHPLHLSYRRASSFIIVQSALNFPLPICHLPMPRHATMGDDAGRRQCKRPGSPCN